MRRDVDMLDRCWDMEFRFYEEKGIALVEKVEKLTTWGVPWTKQAITCRRYDGTSNRSGGSGGYWGRFQEVKG